MTEKVPDQIVPNDSEKVTENKKEEKSPQVAKNQSYSMAANYPPPWPSEPE